MNRPLIYVAHKMTGRFMDELVQEAKLTTRVLNNYGFDVLDPILIEHVPMVHEMLEQTDAERLKRYWERDKQCLQECHMVLDYKSCNKSDGVGVELGLARFCYFKPVFRVFPDAGICISKLEYDQIFDMLTEAAFVMARDYGTKKQILKWRIRMLLRSLPGWFILQLRFIKDLL